MAPSDGRLRGLILAFLVMSALVVVSMGMGSLYVGLRAGDQSAANFEIIKEIEVINKRLLDCTEPKGKCFEAGQKRTGEAVTGIGENTFRVIVAALSCQTDGITNKKALARCTVRRVETLKIPR